MLNNTKILITIYAIFYKDDKDIKFYQLPTEAKNEINEIFGDINSEFYVNAPPYSLDDITHYPIGSKYNRFPSYDIVPKRVVVNLSYIEIHREIKYSKEHYLRQNMLEYYPVTFDDFLFNIKEGFIKLLMMEHLYQNMVNI